MVGAGAALLTSSPAHGAQATEGISWWQVAAAGWAEMGTLTPPPPPAILSPGQPSALTPVNVETFDFSPSSVLVVTFSLSPQV